MSFFIRRISGEISLQIKHCQIHLYWTPRCPRRSSGKLWSIFRTYIMIYRRIYCCKQYFFMSISAFVAAREEMSPASDDVALDYNGNAHRTRKQCGWSLKAGFVASKRVSHKCAILFVTLHDYVFQKRNFLNILLKVKITRKRITTIRRQSNKCPEVGSEF